jgi:NADPH:quinone reductase-like Zn-dependent oxidoreductase
MLHRAKVASGEHVLIAGASGGVGSAAVQLAKLRGAKVTAIVGSNKTQQVLELGADRAIERGKNLVNELGDEAVDVVIVELDLRTFYLKDLTLIGCTAWDEPVFPNLISYIEKNQIRPVVAKIFALKDIAQAQAEFLEKKHFGKFVLVPEH